MILATMKGLGEFKRSVDRRVDAVKKQTWLALVDGALAIQQTAVESINHKTGSSTSVRYNPNRRRRRQRTVLVSDEGEPPNTDTGRLVKSIAVKFMKSENKIEVGSYGLNYAWALEFGSVARGLQPRPWLRPAFLLNQKNIQEALKLAAKGEYR